MIFASRAVHSVVFAWSTNVLAKKLPEARDFHFLWLLHYASINFANTVCASQVVLIKKGEHKEHWFVNSPDIASIYFAVNGI